MLAARGVAAWIAAWPFPGAAAAPAAGHAPTAAAGRPGGAGPLVAVLAQMALAHT